MREKTSILLVVTLILPLSVFALLKARNLLDNPGFENEFGKKHLEMWGRCGDVWGGAHRVRAGAGGHPGEAHGGSFMLCIDEPRGQYSGAWQQVGWEEGTPFYWEAYYLIQGGTLPWDCATRMKTEFYDRDGELIKAEEGQYHCADTGGKWVRDTMSGTAPAGTAYLRIVLIAGSNPEGRPIRSRIYWDDIALYSCSARP